ncbi:LiaF transmembrane domain-containing protein [Companilactobacillus muriivasis]|uniref:LiaF transmembrane domain-containing protein n=1 Tax=Companilactobacillus muriivasis TaxID=3081444 RepID=UPI0030C77AAF
MRNRNGIFWGIFLVLSAAILVVSQMHLITYSFSFWTVAVTIFLAAVLIKSLIYFSIPGTVFSLAFLGIVYAKPLGITAIVPWTLLGAALLVSIGLSMIFRPLIAKHRPWVNYSKGYTRGHHGPFVQMDYTSKPDVETVNDPDVNVYVKMGSSIRYVKSDDFNSANIDVSMGDAKVYFDNVKINDSAAINVDVSFGGAELFVPSDWIIRQGIDTNMGTITEVGNVRTDEDSPEITITGRVSVGSLKITYI